jgi:hypothetical protein
MREEYEKFELQRQFLGKSMKSFSGNSDSTSETVEMPQSSLVVSPPDISFSDATINSATKDT